MATTKRVYQPQVSFKQNINHNTLSFNFCHKVKNLIGNTMAD